MFFATIDVETANPDISSICQIGIAVYHNKIIKEEWMSYIDPQDYFDPINVSIHGIDEEKVKSSPKINREQIKNEKIENIY